MKTIEYALYIRFTIIFLLVTALALAASHFLRAYTGFSRTSILSFLPLFVAALDAGAASFRKMGRRPKAREIWPVAVGFSVIAFLIGLGLAFLFMGAGLVEAFSNPAILMMMLVMLAILLVASFFFFRLGAKIGADAAA